MSPRDRPVSTPTVETAPGHEPPRLRPMAPVPGSRPEDIPLDTGLPGDGLPGAELTGAGLSGAGGLGSVPPSVPAPRWFAWLSRVLGWVVAGAASALWLGLLTLFAVVAFVTGHGAVGAGLLALLLLSVVALGVVGWQGAQRGLRAGRAQLQDLRSEAGLTDADLRRAALRRELALLWTGEGSRLGAAERPALRRAIDSAQRALDLTAAEDYSREAYEVSRAVREDLPEALALYRQTADSAALRSELELIAGRMEETARRLEAERRQAVDARRDYLRGKYGPGT